VTAICAIAACTLLAAPHQPDVLRPTAKVVRVFDFESMADGGRDDLDFNGKPDDWLRILRKGYPHYVKCLIADDHAFAGKRSLRFVLKGGNACYLTPLKDLASEAVLRQQKRKRHANHIAVSADHEYIIDAWVRTEKIENDEVYLSVNFLDKGNRFLRRHRVVSPKVTGSGPWQRITLGPFHPTDPQIASISIGCHVDGKDRPDIHARVWFDRIVVSRIPHLSIRCTRAQNLALVGEPAKTVATVSGIEHAGLKLHLRATDMTGRVLWNETREVGSAPGARFTAEGRLPTAEPGYFRVRAELRHGERPIVSKRMGLLVMPPSAGRGAEEFGWSGQLPPIPLETFVQLAVHGKVGWVKLPLWFEAQRDPNLAGSPLAFSRFAAQLGRQGVRIAAMLREPPRDVVEQLPRPPEGMIDLLLTDPAIWSDSLRGTLRQYGPSVYAWQLGGDTDTALANLPNPEARLAEVHKTLTGIGRHLQLGVPWDWLYPVLAYRKAGMGFVSLDLTGPIAPEQSAHYIREAGKAGGDVWATLRCLPAGRYGRLDRLADLCERVLQAKVAGAKRIFLTDLWHPQVGLLSSEGHPNELFLVYRTLASRLAGARYLGSIQMPGGSRNLLFGQGDQALLVVWNPVGATPERLFLGRGVTRTDVWGNARTLPAQEGKQLVTADRLPVFLSGCSLRVMQWRLAVRLKSGMVRSSYQPHRETIQLTNTFGQGVAGSIRLVLPPQWTAAPDRWPFQIEKGAGAARTGTWVFPLNENVGTKPLRLDFDLSADQRYRFSVYRPIHFGAEEVDLRIETRLDAGGEILVKQTVANYTDGVLSFRCWVDAPYRKRQTATIVKLGAGARDTKFYRLAKGHELTGQHLRVTLEQIGGRRYINKRVEITH